jgi:hypothetical protein
MVPKARSKKQHYSKLVSFPTFTPPKISLPISDPRREKLFRYYLGFNFPISTVKEWLVELLKYVSSVKAEWKDELNDSEKWLLEELMKRRWLNIQKTTHSTSKAKPNDAVPKNSPSLEQSNDLYVISHLPSQIQTPTHKLQHAFLLSPLPFPPCTHTNYSHNTSLKTVATSHH